MKDLITLPGKIHTSQIIDFINITYSELKTLRDNGKLIEGKFYRITDYVTTTMQNDTRSAGHPFDVIVRADSPSVLNEQAWAARHDGDAYFSNSNLEAWELKYKLDNEKWSSRICTIIEDKNDGYRASSLGTVDIDGQTYILWDASEFTEDYGFSFLVSLTKEEGAEMWVYYPDTGEKGEDTRTSISTIIAEITDEGKGTILWMKDEFGNECPYDFKNIMFKRWLATDSDADRHGLNNRYVIADINTLPNGLSVEDDSDYIWAFTFSSDASGSEQTDFSLSSSHSVHHNVFKACTSGLPNNVMFGNDNYSNVFGSDCKYNSWGNYCSNNSWGNSCKYNSWGNNCNNNSWGNDITQSTVFDGVQYTKTAKVKNIQVLNGLAGTLSSKLTLNFAANKDYTQVATKTSAGELKIYVPGDLA